MADKYLNQTGVQVIKTWAEGKFALDSDLDTLAAEVDELITEGGEPNVIETVKVNGTALTPDANKAVDITVPTAGSAQNTSGYATYGDMTTGLAGKADTSDIPTDLSDLTNTGQDPYATESYVDQNGGKIDSISVNGTAQTIDANKNVDITVPNTAATTSADGLMSSTDKAKLDGIETGAEANVQADWNQSTSSADDFIKNKPTKLSDFTNDGDGTSGSTFPTTAEMNTAIGNAVASAYVYKGSVATVADLPSSGNTAGDVYDVQATGVNYAWTGSAWDALGTYVDTTVLWTSVTGQNNTLEAMTVAEVNAILEPSS